MQSVHGYGVDVPVNRSDKLQQPFQFRHLGASDSVHRRVLDISVMPQGQAGTVPNCAANSEDCTSAVLG